MTARECLKVEEHKLALDRAKSTDEILATLSRYQVQDTNAIAIDRHGTTLLADGRSRRHRRAPRQRLTGREHADS